MANAEKALYLQAFLASSADRRDEPNEVYTFLFEPVPKDYAKDRRTPRPDWLTAIRLRLDAFLFDFEEAFALMRLLVDFTDGNRVTVWEIEDKTSTEALRSEWVFDTGDEAHRLYLGMSDRR